MLHREERDFSVHLHLSAEFPEDYEGDDDGFVWAERFERLVKPRLVAAVFEALRAEPGWSALAAPRGHHPERALDLDVRCNPRP